MPNVSDHLRLAKRLLGTLNHLLQEQEKHSEWIAVTAFYRSLHLSEAVLLTKNIPHDRTHVGREQALKRTNSTANIWKHYRSLWQASCIARYLAFHDDEYANFSSYLTPSEVHSELVRHRLREIEKSVALQLNKAVDEL
ncbi:MAG TPA: hypothetical protein VM260_22880 [Pirellula sp.]|nr:hypothetical protein [Pirellula sp.]